MIGGVLVDLLVVAAVGLFGWAGVQLGGTAAVARLVESSVAFVVAVLARDPAGELIQLALGASDDFCNLLGMLVVGAVAYLAVGSLVRWWLARREVRRDAAGVGELDEDLLDDSRLAAVAGAVLGLGWSLVFASLLVLVPVDNVLARSAVRSATGGVLIAQEGGLRWFADGFPHYTQRLPKGELGAVVGERDELPMRGGVTSRERPRDVDVLMRTINLLRSRTDVAPLAYEVEVGTVASRHASFLVRERRLTRSAPGGGSLDARVRSALGESWAGSTNGSAWR